MDAEDETQTLTITAETAESGLNNEILTITYGINGVGGTATVAVDLTAVDITDSDAVAAAVNAALNLNATFAALATSSGK